MKKWAGPSCRYAKLVAPCEVYSATSLMKILFRFNPDHRK